MIAAIDAGQLAGVVWVSFLAGVGITTAYSFVVLGTGRSAEARRAGHSAAAIGYAALAVLMLCVFAGAVVYGVHIMLSKS
jgi:hypothetical protein